MKERNDREDFAVLALRHFDGSAGAAEVRQLERLLREFPEFRRDFLELSQAAAMLSDHYRVEIEAAGSRFGRKPSRQAGRAMATVAALLVAGLISVGLVWDASDRKPAKLAALRSPAVPWKPDLERLSWNFDWVSLVDEGYGLDSIEAASLDRDSGVDAGIPDALRLVGNFEFEFVPFNFLTGESIHPIARVPSPTVLF